MFAGVFNFFFFFLSLSLASLFLEWKTIIALEKVHKITMDSYEKIIKIENIFITK